MGGEVCMNVFCEFVCLCGSWGQTLYKIIDV